MRWRSGAAAGAGSAGCRNGCGGEARCGRALLRLQFSCGWLAFVPSAGRFPAASSSLLRICAVRLR
jgi:hypothetical protein